MARRLSIDDLPVATIVLHRSGGARSVNRRWTELTGLPRDASLAEHWLDAVQPGERRLAQALLDRAAASDAPTVEELTLLATASPPKKVSVHMTRRDDEVLAVLFDTSPFHAREEELERRATHDPLTGLLNRDVLADRARLALDRFARSGRPPAVLYIDLDGFKDVNDVHGHRLGDHVLQEVARRMQAVARPVDTLARVGGDEFVLLCEDLGGAAEAYHVADRLRQSAAEPLSIDGLNVSVDVSVGIAFAADTDESLDSLLARADADLYHAKAHGRWRGTRSPAAALHPHRLGVAGLRAALETVAAGLRATLADTGGSERLHVEAAVHSVEGALADLRHADQAGADEPVEGEG